ncbi:amphi-Trp domain-containing protein [Pallidibacillus pasinlerensis]|uniref:Amphi-Trp domain-containing protein n=1 Tax=Pallidibacillus pasinlerensis TaxID=2703818 RepID=A0ABX0A3S0_9BACI|nr:amphi-Trp domain-containing protein [Pallidibacillus pasinlerensis]NCU18057.1 amphi-Trp domain-containing protein [Pallidibacillus pasinlerensis]
MQQQQQTRTQVLLKHKENQNLHQFVTTLETIAKRLREEQEFVFMQGNEEIVINPSDDIKVEFKYEVKGDKHSFEIEFDWYEGQGKKSMKIL